MGDVLYTPEVAARNTAEFLLGRLEADAECDLEKWSRVPARLLGSVSYMVTFSDGERYVLTVERAR
jgi:hypothetical protein